MLYKRKTTDDRQYARYLFPKADVLRRVLKYLAAGVKIQRLFRAFENLTFWRSIAELVLLIFGILIFIAHPTQLWFIWLHIVHLASAGTGIFAWFFLRQEFFIDMMEDFPLDKRRKMGLDEFEDHLADSVKKILKPRT